MSTKQSEAVAPVDQWRFKRYFTTEGWKLEDVPLVCRKTKITNPDGSIVFEHPEVWVPSSWSQLATDILSSKYFRRGAFEGAPKGETSVYQVIKRIVNTIVKWGLKHNYYLDQQEADVMRDELSFMLIHQIGAFNSPVWFNCGLFHEHGIDSHGVGSYAWDEETGTVKEVMSAYERPQCSACFIQHVEDDLMGIADLVKKEMRLFKFGSGTGTNFSNLRAEGEPLSGGGTSSGVMSFLNILDAAAGATKSGGSARRSAKMVVLDDDHPEVLTFIQWKAKEEKKAQVLIEHGGLPADFNGEAYRTVGGQNSNNSVRLSDEFMKAYEEDREWEFKARRSGAVMGKVKAREMMRQIAQSAWSCADPGVHFKSEMNKWNTVKNSAEIRATNPCVSADTLIATKNGPKRITELLNQSSIILGGDGNLYPVFPSFYSGEKEVFLLKTKRGREVKLTKDHKVYTRNRGDVPASELTPEDILDIKNFMFGVVSIDTKLGELIGAWMGDGCVSAEKNTDHMISFEPVGIESVYDLEEPVTRHFIANGLVVHNCSEFVFVDNTACNLASINLMKCYTPSTGVFNSEAYLYAITMFFFAQEILVDLSSYPSPELAKNSHNFRPLGLGYANLGALLMTMGLPYDSDEGRSVAAALTSVLTGQAYTTSAYIASRVGPFSSYDVNKIPMQEVMQLHYNSFQELTQKDTYKLPDRLSHLTVDAICAWASSLSMGSEYGYRNAQATVIAPTGTIGLLMDCDTTGIEPDFALVKYKKLAGGGTVKIINQSVRPALLAMGYSLTDTAHIVEHILDTNSVHNAPRMDKSHYPVFDCANEIPYLAHLKMLEAVQPFLSGSISKTINMPNSATVEDIEQAYVWAWKHGLKCVAIYRDGCKQSQPLNKAEKVEDKKQIRAAEAPQALVRKRLPLSRAGTTHELVVGGHKFYLRTGQYDDGQLGEIFIDVHKAGASLRSIMHCFAMSVSLGLQYGVPLEEYVDCLTFTRFDPSGMTNHPRIRMATSIVDLVFRVLGDTYLNRVDLTHVSDKDLHADITPRRLPEVVVNDAPFCTECGSPTVRNGTCYKCLNCGTSQGCS